MKNVFFYEYPVGILGIAEEEGALTDVFFSTGAETAAKDNSQKAETPLIKQAALQLKEYFNRSRTLFSLPLKPQGTEFQRAVWNALLTIPYSETRTYGDIAFDIGKPRASRAVGMANNRNPIVIIIPCHRVIGADGSLTGYGGGLEAKRFLLDLEGAARPGRLW